MVISCHSQHSKRCAIVLIGALSTAASLTVQDSAHAQGLFDFLFGGFQQRPALSPEPNAYPAPPSSSVGRIAPAPLGHESVNDGGDSAGHTVAFCVRLCDGQHFPLEKMVNGTPVETCRAICPYSKTKVFFGSEIGAAVAEDGQKYAGLQTAFIYRKQLVADCTCNGKDAFGLASFDVRDDPTLRPGDIVSTKEGLLAFTGRSGSTAAFVPVNSNTLPVDIKPGSQLRSTPGTDPTADNQRRLIVPPEKRQPQIAPPVVNSQGNTAK